jgi:hypothetical protein
MSSRACCRALLLLLVPALGAGACAHRDAQAPQAPAAIGARSPQATAPAAAAVAEPVAGAEDATVAEPVADADTVVAKPGAGAEAAPIPVDAPGEAATTGDVFYRVPLDQLVITEGVLPRADPDEISWRAPRDQLAYAVLDGAGDVVVADDGPVNRWWPNHTPEWVLSVRAPEGSSVSGRLFVPRPAQGGFESLRFTIPVEEARPDGASVHARDRAQAAEDLWTRGVPGAAWYRHEALQAWREAGDAAPADERVAQGAATRRRWRGDVGDSYELFSGSRALAENLALERDLAPDPRPGDETVELAGIEGITIAAIDWAPLLDAAPPALDPLASRLPGDQHALLFPSSRALIAVLDEAEANGTPLVDLLESRSVDALARRRLERQLALSLDALRLAPTLVQAIAVTGSDFDLRLGSDVAVLLQSGNAPALAGLLRAAQLAALAGTSGAVASEGETGGIAWTAVRTPDRTLCSYLAAIDDVVLVTNSPAQLQQLAAVRAGAAPSLAVQPEYVFFRQRYVRGAPGESALLVITDPAIRRLCGPRWRILQSRRTRALALLAEQAAVAIDEERSAQPSDAHDARDLDVYGSLAFLTPIAELPLTRVSASEAAAYESFRTNYQRSWRRSFDPIAVRLGVDSTTLAADLTVMPLILDSDYRDMVDLAKGAVIGAGDGDRHADALLQLVLAVNSASSELDFARPASPVETPADGSAPPPDPLAWMGSCLGLWFDDDPVWDELQADDQGMEYFGDHLERLPLALFVEVRDAAGARAFVDALLDDNDWITGIRETRSHAGLEYLKVLVFEGSQGTPGDSAYFAVTPDMLIVTPHEQVLHHALERSARRAEGAAPADAAPWAGRSANLHVSRTALDALARGWGFGIGGIDDSLNEQCFANLPILGEWRRLFPGEEPVAAHERLWHERLVCPRGGRYAWNEAWHTVACSVCGHPGEPADDPPRPAAWTSFHALDLGLTFEHEGLRAQVTLQRTAR